MEQWKKDRDFDVEMRKEVESEWKELLDRLGARGAEPAPGGLRYTVPCSCEMEYRMSFRMGSGMIDRPQRSWRRGAGLTGQDTGESTYHVVAAPADRSTLELKVRHTAMKVLALGKRFDRSLGSRGQRYRQIGLDTRACLTEERSLHLASGWMLASLVMSLHVAGVPFEATKVMLGRTRQEARLTRSCRGPTMGR